MADAARAAAAAHEELLCPVCIELPDGIVYQCHEGHIICADCEPQLPTRACPQCRVALPAQRIRNRTAERQIALMPATCSHCAVATTRGEKAVHERDCPQRPRQCAAVELGCAWTGLVAGQRSHEAACPFAMCHRIIVPLRERVAELEPQVAELPSLHEENERLQARGRVHDEQLAAVRARIAALDSQYAALLDSQHDVPQLAEQLQQNAGLLRQQVAENAGLRARVAELQQAGVAELQPLRAENVRLRARVETLEEAEEARPLRRQRVGPAPHEVADAAAREQQFRAQVRRELAAAAAEALQGALDAEPAAAAAPTLDVIRQMGIVDVVAALRTHVAAAPVVEYAFLRVETLMVEGNSNRRALIEAGVLEAVVAALQAHPQSEEVQREGVGLLSYVFMMASAAVVGARYQRMVEAGAIEVAVAAARALPHAENVQRRACLLLCRLGGHGDSAAARARVQRAARAGAVEALVAMMRNHTQDEGLHSWVCAVLTTFCSDDDEVSAACKHRAVAAGAKALLERALAAFEEDGEDAASFHQDARRIIAWF